MNQSELRGYKRGERDERKRCGACIPTNWCDSLLSGPDAILPEKGPYTAMHIEKLLIALRKRIGA